MSQISNDAITYQADVLSDLHARFVPHKGQVVAANAIFYQNKKLVMLDCGRKFGKSELIAYLAYRWSMSYPNSIVYIIGPFIKQMREILWSDDRITYFLGKNTEADSRWIASRTQQDLRVKFCNNSFIKLDGADNYEAFRGPNPHLVLYDEFKDHHPKFDEGMRPNLLSHSAPLIVVGTPPDCEENPIPTEEENTFYQFMHECKSDPDGAYFNMPTYVNPHISIEDLKKIENRYRLRGEYHVFQREYLAMHVSSASTHIFPMFDSSKHIRRYSELLVEILKSPKNYEYYISFDPATTSTFAALLVCIHRYSKVIYVIDEVYKTTPSECVTRVVFEEARQKWRSVYEMDDDWCKTYDYAAAWFAAEVMDLFDYYLTPCTKDLKDKENKISVIKDLMLNGYFFISDRCTNTIREIQKYKKNEKGIIVKVDDHNIDNLRYILNAASYTTTSYSDYIPPNPDIRGYTPNNDIMNNRDSNTVSDENDWIESMVTGELYD